MKTSLFKFLYRIVPTEKFLHTVGISDSPNCFFCNGETETLVHLFWHCPKVQLVWQTIIGVLNEILTPPAPSSDPEPWMIHNFKNHKSLPTNVAVIVKMYTFSCKYSDQKLNAIT